ncbi:MAG: branched-chain amino acid ABC transporter permease [Bacillota bacterium]
MKASSPFRFWPGAVAVAILVAVPFVASGYITALTLSLLMYVALAYGWNLISGYTGYVSFGQVAFFGVGGYTCAILAKAGMNWLVGSLIGGVIAGLLAVVLGLVMLRLKGAYFAIGMLGLAQLFAAVAGALKRVTNGSTGIFLPPSLSLVPVYLALLSLALTAVVGTAILHRSTFGLRLMAIREDEEAAESLGIHTTVYKIIAFSISAVVIALAGGVMTWYISFIDPQSAFPAALNLTMVIMTVFGGPGTVWGPLVGASTLGIIAELLWANYPGLYLVIYGVILLLIVLYIPQGVVPSLSKLLRRRGAAETVRKGRRGAVA